MMVGGVLPPNVDDVFGSAVYTGNATGSRSITTGIDLSSNAGMVTTKNLGQNDGFKRFDTERGATKYLEINRDTAEATDADTLVSFDAGGVTIGDSDLVNQNSRDFMISSFVRSRRFFDVVTYTGDGTGVRTINHGLFWTPGHIEAKQTSSSGSSEMEWAIYNRALYEDDGTMLFYGNSTAFSSSNHFGSGSTITPPTSALFTVGSALNESGKTYVAYLYAHDPDGICATGIYTGNGSATGPVVTLGWEPQFLLIKSTTRSENWSLYDAVNDATNPRTEVVFYNLVNSISTGGGIDFGATSFQPVSNDNQINRNTEKYIYLAIRAS